MPPVYGRSYCAFSSACGICWVAADRRLSLIRVAEVQVAVNLARAQRRQSFILQTAFTIRA